MPSLVAFVRRLSFLSLDRVDLFRIDNILRRHIIENHINIGDNVKTRLYAWLLDLHDCSMASVDEQLTQLTDPSLLDKIDALRELNISEYAPLPQVICCARRSIDARLMETL